MRGRMGCMEPDKLILRAAQEAQMILDRTYASGGEPKHDSPLAQLGLRDGLAIVQEYLRHGELGAAFEHLAYMVNEPSLSLSEPARQDIDLAGQILGLTHLLE